MKKNPVLFFLLLLFLIPCFLGASASRVRAEDSLLKIQVFPDQDIVKTGMMFLVNVQVANSSSDSSSDFWANNCSFEKHWVTDNSEVLIQSWTCEENTLEPITLDPSGVYEKNIILYIPQKDKSGPMTFRLGFKRMSEDGDTAEPLWSDPVTVSVIVPEEMKGAAPAVSVTEQAEDTKEAKDAASSVSAEMQSMPQHAEAGPESVTASVSQAGVFQDPGVPIKIHPGDGFSISLVSNPSTGFRWKMTLPEGDKSVTFLGSEHVVSEEVMPGVPGQEVFKFKAMNPGETKADFVYERPWETKIAPTRKIFTILVQEN